MADIEANATIDLGVRQGGRYVLAASGGFGGGTLTVSHKRGAKLVTQAAKTAAFVEEFVAAGPELRLVLAGATTPTIDYMLQQDHKPRG